MKIVSAKKAGYESNKDIVFKKINSVYIEKFRSISKKNIILGNNITILSGKNGTMKSSILGLIAHPFSPPNNAKDVFNEKLKVDLSEIFKLSKTKDIDKYSYIISATTLKEKELSESENKGKIEFEEIEISEKIRMFFYELDNRHRVVVGASNDAGRGNFHLNTSFLNLKRLFPLIETNAQKTDFKNINIKNEHDFKKFISDGYFKILQREDFKNPIPISEKNKKQTFGPSEDSYYEFNSISTGEDNLGLILAKMYSFMQDIENDISKKNALQGILCIDELESGLHPVAQANLFDFILQWSKKYNIQVVFTTHSLYLIQHALNIQNFESEKDNISINIISTAFVDNRNYNIIHNPEYNKAYKELTFKDATDINSIYEINLLCEDDIAEYTIKKIIENKSISKYITILYGITGDYANSGTSCSALKSLIKNGAKLLSDSIIIFDPEVDIDDLNKYNNVSYLKIPSLNNFPIEKEIVKFIYDLNGSNPFFISQNKERDSFISDFAHSNIISNLNDMKELSDASIKPFKKWAKQNTEKFKEYIDYYINANPKMINVFLLELYQSINEKLSENSLPLLDINELQINNSELTAKDYASENDKSENNDYICTKFEENEPYGFNYVVDYLFDLAPKNGLNFRLSQLDDKVFSKYNSFKYRKNNRFLTNQFKEKYSNLFEQVHADTFRSK